MAHHKRRRPKNRRAGCLLCKSHKANGAKDKRKTKIKGIKGKISDLDSLQILSILEGFDFEC